MPEKKTKTTKEPKRLGYLAEHPTKLYKPHPTEDGPRSIHRYSLPCGGGYQVIRKFPSK